MLTRRNWAWLRPMRAIMATAVFVEGVRMAGNNAVGAGLIESRLPPAWVDVLRSAGRLAMDKGQALYLVGGVVRDLLLGRPVVDLDLVVEGDAVALARQLAQQSGGRARTHPRFGTAKVELADWSADLATARSETYAYPGALPEVAPGTMAQDLGRRDFTINALAFHLAPSRFGELLDPHGGLADLKAGLVRVLHAKSFVDDATRILRALRYEQRLGFRLEPATEALVRRHARMLDTISGDRVRHEFELIFQEGGPEAVLACAEELQVLAIVSPGMRAGHLGPALGRARDALGPAGLTSGLCFLFLAYPLSEAQMETFVRRLRFPAKLARSLRELPRLKVLLSVLEAPDVSAGALYHSLQPFSAQALLALSLVLEPGLAQERVRLYLERLCYVKTELDGDALMQMGVRPGPGLGKLLRALLDARLEGTVASRQQEEQFVRRWMAQRREGA